MRVILRGGEGFGAREAAQDKDAGIGIDDRREAGQQRGIWKGHA